VDLSEKVEPAPRVRSCPNRPNGAAVMRTSDRGCRDF
jgi:hypothetical protein